GVSPFYANYGYHPATIDPAILAVPTNAASQFYPHWLHAVHKDIQQSLEKARERMRKYADLKR
ncbi:hypothetical protein FN846DRAFT_763995, partial [Sphaerosporella brunnea]